MQRTGTLAHQKKVAQKYLKRNKKIKILFNNLIYFTLFDTFFLGPMFL